MQTPFQSLTQAIVLSGVVLALAATAALAQEAPSVDPSPPRPVLANPSWERPPIPEFPERAISRRITEGSATIACSVEPDGGLSACRIVAETPPRVGFGAAALSAARRSRLSLESVGRAEPGAEVIMVLRFGSPYS